MSFPGHLMQPSHLIRTDKNRLVFKTGSPAVAVFHPAPAISSRGQSAQKALHCDALSVRPSACLLLPADALRQTLQQQDPALALEWIAALSGNLRRQRSALERIALKGTRARIVHYLVDRGDKGRFALDQPLIEWARELGVSHEALYRTLAAMEKKGSLARDGATLQLLKGLP